MAIKTTWTEVNQIIKEEFQRLVEKKKIQSRIQQINEELAMMEEEDSDLMEEETLDEVEAGGLEKIDSDTGLERNVKFKAKFDKKGNTLMEEDELEDDDDELSLSDEFAELGAAIEAKIMAALGKSEEESDDEEIEVEIPEDSEGDEEGEEFEEVEVGEEDEDEGEEEPIDEDEMKSKSLNESTTVGNKKYLKVLSEGLDNRKKNALEGEIERMRRLALGSND